MTLKIMFAAVILGIAALPAFAQESVDTTVRFENPLTGKPYSQQEADLIRLRAKQGPHIDTVYLTYSSGLTQRVELPSRR